MLEMALSVCCPVRCKQSPNPGNPKTFLPAHAFVLTFRPLVSSRHIHTTLNRTNTQRMLQEWLFSDWQASLLPQQSILSCCSCSDLKCAQLHEIIRLGHIFGRTGVCWAAAWRGPCGTVSGILESSRHQHSGMGLHRRAHSGRRVLARSGVGSNSSGS